MSIYSSIYIYFFAGVFFVLRPKNLIFKMDIFFCVQLTVASILPPDGEIWKVLSILWCVLEQPSFFFWAASPHRMWHFISSWEWSPRSAPLVFGLPALSASVWANATQILLKGALRPGTQKRSPKALSVKPKKPQTHCVSINAPQLTELRGVSAPLNPCLSFGNGRRRL